MKWKLHTPEQIVTKLCEADAMLAAGGSVDQVSRQLGISEATYYNWRKQYGQMKSATWGAVCTRDRSGALTRNAKKTPQKCPLNPRKCPQN